jgi:flagellar basal-body rod protein FlgF
LENALYTTLTRQSGLLREMETVANNIANLSTTGFRREGLIFAEHLAALDGGEPSLSMASAEGRAVSLAQGVLGQTGGSFDFAIEGEGFFMVATPDGNRLTRAGAFTRSGEGELMTATGDRLLDAGGAPISIPAEAGAVTLGPDGTLSAGGEPLAQIGLFRPESPFDLIHAGGTLFRTRAEPQPMEGGTIVQGFLESSNVNPVAEVTRMIAVQRAYELGQGFLDAEDDRVRSVLQTLGR